MFKDYCISGSIRAGAFIALGCIIYLLAPSAILGALLFSLGLLSIGLTQSYLYTGQVHQLIEGDRKWSDMLWIWVGNITGIWAMSLLAEYGLNMGDAMQVVAQTKVAIPWVELFCRSVLCGGLMTMATRKSSPKYVTIGCVFAFVLCGFNHCVADAFYLMQVPIWEGLPRLLLITLGNTIGGLLPVWKTNPTSRW